MPKYLGRVKFTPEGLNGLRQSGAAGRLDNAKAVAASVGGSMECYYFAFGDYDAYGLFDLPDDEAAAAISIAVNSTGIGSATITKLLTADQVDEAFRRTVDYRPPGT